MFHNVCGNTPCSRFYSDLSSRWTVVELLMVIWPVKRKYDVIHKTGSIQRRQRRTEPLPQTTIIK